MQNRKIKDVNETNIYTELVCRAALEGWQLFNRCVCLCGFLEAEWTEWFDRDDERGSGDWEKLSDLHKAFPERLCSNPLDIEVNI